MKVEQTLHGYNNGHHLIAGSINLPLDDADRMSYLSDWSGYVNPMDGETCYLTAYPLEKSHQYVIAKTWYAEEMSRPGCVWTHSLLVDLDSLGQDDDLYELLKLFRRPLVEGDDFRSYTLTQELKIEKNINKHPLIEGIEPTRLLFLSAGLLERNKPLVYAVEKETEFYEDFCMRLIQSIPNGILKDISICTGSANSRKIGTKFFNLQFVVGKGESLFTELADNESRPVADKGFQFWLDSILDGRRDVSQMIHRFSKDIGNNSQHFLAVVNLLRLLNDKMRAIDPDSSLDDILIHLTNEFKAREEGKELKHSFLSEPVTKLFCDERTFILSLCTTSAYFSIDYQQIGFEARVEKYRKENGADEYLSLLVELSKANNLNDEGRALLVRSIEGMTKDEVVHFANQYWNLFKTIVTLNNRILADGYWIELPPPQFLSLFAIFQRNIPEDFHSWEELYDRLLIIDAFVTDTICHAFSEYVDRYVETALDRWNSQRSMPVNNAIMTLCMRQKGTVLHWMSQQADINNVIRNNIKTNFQPDEAVVRNAGSEVWKAFVKEELEYQHDANNLVFIYVLAFNWYDYNSLAYIKGVLPYIYEALSVENLSNSSWKRIEKFTGSVPFWRSWDNCRKVLIGVRDYCKDLNLKDADIENFTTNKKLNGELMELWRKR